ncbi:MalY/PatB family protein [Thalassobaculum litoreum]|uniref:cysteine-S-conjugate beta-lyase n=1 Tax=Thalassobaculum litoreum DSM 18839 TaxID=1123362 RepID=A0A8G2EYU0_9PROT|nr:MalY/PatB family protein [Thalassobaculum litoreum]SDF95539.1 cystathione beta-lyase [Thalassobaculum litoreum DSM 18839]
MPFDFDEIIDRENTHSVKWDYHNHGGFAAWDKTYGHNGADRVLPMWVADMDFRCPPAVTKALGDLAAHGIFGYSAKTDDYVEAVCTWFRTRQGWDAQGEWLITAPGVVPTLNVVVRAFTQPGDKVIVQRPVYYPFFRVTTNNGCEVVSNSLILEDGAYRMDLEDLEAKAKDPKARLLILCSPHNPIGRVWSAEEQSAVAEICARHGVIVVADEIHGDLMFPGETFTPFATLGDTAAQNTIVCTAPSKTFNLAGLHTSNIFIPNPALREQFAATYALHTLPGMNPFGIAATMAAYRGAGEWLDAVMAYVAGNADRLIAFFGQEVPEIRAIRPQGTYLQWFDCRALGLDKDALEDLMLNRARVYFDEGYIFGDEGAGFERINLACPRSVLDEALVRIRDAVRAHRA